MERTKFINILKSHSSKTLRKKFGPYLQNKLRGDNFWSSRYCIAPTGNVTIVILKDYAENQRKGMPNA